jgi:hypothetical protein
MAIDDRQLRHTPKRLAGIVWQPRHVTLDQIKPPQRRQLGLVPCDVDRERETVRERIHTYGLRTGVGQREREREREGAAAAGRTRGARVATLLMRLLLRSRLVREDSPAAASASNPPAMRLSAR